MGEDEEGRGGRVISAGHGSRLARVTSVGDNLGTYMAGVQLQLMQLGVDALGGEAVLGGRGKGREDALFDLH